VNPNDIFQIRDGLEKILTDAPLRGTLIDKGFANVARFSWKNNAEVLLSLFNRVLKPRGPDGLPAGSVL